MFVSHVVQRRLSGWGNVVIAMNGIRMLKKL